jgi:hypothetical protein
VRNRGDADILGSIVNYLIISLILVEVFVQVRARSAVVGSRQRYVALSFRRVLSWLVNAAFVGQGLIELSTNQQTGGWTNIIVGLLCSFLELRNHNNDDDWFNGRGAKIRRGIRKLLTAPSPQAAPAFGMRALRPVDLG